MTNPSQIVVSELIAQTNSYAASGDVDSTSNLFNDRVFIFAGTLDTTVDPGRLLLLQTGIEDDLSKKDRGEIW